MDINNLFGTWGLDRFWFTDDAGVEVDPLGRTPVGDLILGHDTHYAFTMMRGNRSSDFITYFTESGQLRFIPPPDIPDEVRNQ